MVAPAGGRDILSLGEQAAAAAPAGGKETLGGREGACVARGGRVCKLGSWNYYLQHTSTRRKNDLCTPSIFIYKSTNSIIGSINVKFNASFATRPFFVYWDHLYDTCMEENRVEEVVTINMTARMQALNMLLVQANIIKIGLITVGDIV